MDRFISDDVEPVDSLRLYTCTECDLSKDSSQSCRSGNTNESCGLMVWYGMLIYMAYRHGLTVVCQRSFVLSLSYGATPSHIAWIDAYSTP